MIAYLSGKVISIEESSMIVETNGIGYEVFVPYTNGLPPATIGEQVKIYIHEHIKEDAYDLYGFMAPLQKNLFRKLISVSGIGAKSALQILTMYGDDELIRIIESQDSKALSKVSGIGPKTAQRVILELKDSIGKMAVRDLTQLMTGLTPDHSNAQEEAIEALVALGYTMALAKKAVKAIFVYDDSVEDLIKKALPLLMD